MTAIIALGIFLVIVYWGQIIGWGTSILTSSSSKALVNAPDLPGLLIAHRLWGAGWVFVLAAAPGHRGLGGPVVVPVVVPQQDRHGDRGRDRDPGRDQQGQVHAVGEGGPGLDRGRAAQPGRDRDR